MSSQLSFRLEQLIGTQWPFTERTPLRCGLGGGSVYVRSLCVIVREPRWSVDVSALWKSRRMVTTFRHGLGDAVSIRGGIGGRMGSWRIRDVWVLGPQPHQKAVRGVLRTLTPMTDEHEVAATADKSWNRGDGEPDRELLEAAIGVVRKHCEPTRIVLFGSAARGELTNDSDIDLLVVVPDAPYEERRAKAFDIEEEIGYDPRADVLVATEGAVADAAGTLAGILRTAAEEGLTVYEAGAWVPYRRRARPEPSEERVSAERARSEAVRLMDGAKECLGRAQRYDAISREYGEDRSACDRTRIAGGARKAVEFALQAVIVAAGKRPRAWKSPAALATEAATTGVNVPETRPGTLEQAAEHYTGMAYPGYPSPDEAETATALETAQLMVAWAEGAVGVAGHAEASQ